MKRKTPDITNTLDFPILFVTTAECGNNPICYHVFKPDSTFPIGIKVAQKLIDLQSKKTILEAYALYSAIEDVLWDYEREVSHSLLEFGDHPTPDQVKTVRNVITHNRKITLDIISIACIAPELKDVKELGSWNWYNVDKKNVFASGPFRVVEVYGFWDSERAKGETDE